MSDMTRTRTQGAPLRPPQNGYAVRAFRECRGQALQWLADTVEVSAPHMRNIENEYRAATPELLTRIARALDVPVAALKRDPAGEAVAS